MDIIYKMRRFSLPKRPIELIAVTAITSTLFLFLHTQNLTYRLKQMEEKLQPNYNTNIERDLNLIAESQERDSWKYKQESIEYTENTNINVLSSLNNTKLAQHEVVFFNRVPKVGSQTFMELLRRLSIKNDFKFHRDAVQRVETIRLAPFQQEELAEMVSELPTPSVYVKHVCYTNFSKFDLPSPIYINLVRDPIERIISWYYYIRAPWYYVERKQAFPDLPLPDPRWLKKDFETCVLRKDPECTYKEGETHEGIGDHRRQTLFFCGHENECTPFNTVEALERAKYAVESQYAVVGVLEDLNLTLSVFEKYIPRFFTGAQKIYWNEVKNFDKINKNIFKPPVKEDIKDIVRKNFTREIEFYQFCKQRLYKQYLATQRNN